MGVAGRIGEERNHENELAQWKQTNPVSTADCGGADVWLDAAGEMCIRDRSDAIIFSARTLVFER